MQDFPTRIVRIPPWYKGILASPLMETSYTIYMLKCRDPLVTDIYVGSTMNVVTRMKYHRHGSKHVNTPVYQAIRANGGWLNWEMVVLETYMAVTRTLVAKREGYWHAKLHARLNVQYPGRTFAEYAWQVFTCPCGSNYSMHHKRRHERSQFHQCWEIKSSHPIDGGIEVSPILV